MFKVYITCTSKLKRVRIFTKATGRKTVIGKRFVTRNESLKEKIRNKHSISTLHGVFYF